MCVCVCERTRSMAEKKSQNEGKWPVWGEIKEGEGGGDLYEPRRTTSCTKTMFYFQRLVDFFQLFIMLFLSLSFLFVSIATLYLGFTIRLTDQTGYFLVYVED